MRRTALLGAVAMAAWGVGTASGGPLTQAQRAVLSSVLPESSALRAAADEDAVRRFPVLAHILANPSETEGLTPFARKAAQMTEEELDALAQGEAGDGGQHLFRAFEPPPAKGWRRGGGRDEEDADERRTAAAAAAVASNLIETRSSSAAFLLDGEDVPETFDPRDKEVTGGVSCAPERVGMQSCNLCAVWASTEAFSWRYCMAARRWEKEMGWTGEVRAERPALSKQYFTDCVIGECGPGTHYAATYAHMQNEGWPSAECRPLTLPRVGECRDGACADPAADPHRYRLERFDLVKTARDLAERQLALKRVLVAEGPVYASISVPQTVFMMYGGVDSDGNRYVFSTERRKGVKNTNHAVTIIGYGPDYWILQNSWGSWGDAGYGYIRMGMDYLKWTRLARPKPELRLSDAKKALLAEHLARRELDKKTASYRVAAADSEKVGARLREAADALDGKRLGGAGAAGASLKRLAAGWKAMSKAAASDAADHAARCEAFYALVAPLPWYAASRDWSAARAGGVACEEAIQRDANELARRATAASEALRWLMLTEDGDAVFKRVAKVTGAYCTVFRRRKPDLCAAERYAGWPRPHTKAGGRTRRAAAAFGDRATDLLSLMAGSHVASGAEWWASLAGAPAAGRACRWMAQACCGVHGSPGTGFGDQMCPVRFEQQQQQQQE